MRRPVLSIAAVLVLLVAACGDSSTEVLEGELSRVVEVPVDSKIHVPGEVDYPTSPPAGGDHFFAWQNCGFYDQPLIDEVAVHSLEHGAVWVTHKPDTDIETLSAIGVRSVEESHMLVSPYENQDSPLVLTAWGRQLSVDSWDDPAVDEFLDQYLGRRSPTAPEAGASCEGAIGDPPSDPTANYEEAIDAMEELEG